MHGAGGNLIWLKEVGAESQRHRHHHHHHFNIFTERIGSPGGRMHFPGQRGRIVGQRHSFRKPVVFKMRFEIFLQFQQTITDFGIQ